jgi:hypothetical protein
MRSRNNQSRRIRTWESFGCARSLQKEVCGPARDSRYSFVGLKAHRSSKERHFQVLVFKLTPQLKNCFGQCLLTLLEVKSVQHRTISATTSLLLWFEKRLIQMLLWSGTSNKRRGHSSIIGAVCWSLCARTKTAAYSSATLYLTDFSRKPHFQHRNWVFTHHRKSFNITGLHDTLLSCYCHHIETIQPRRCLCPAIRNVRPQGCRDQTFRAHSSLRARRWE